MEKKKENKKISRKALNQFLTCVSDYKTPSILAALLVAIEVVFDVFIPIVMSQILNVGMRESATEFTFCLEMAATGKIPLPVSVLYSHSYNAISI